MTVLMPVFDSERYLREAIDSVLAQSFADFELLLCDDGSTDGSLEIMRSYSDPRVQVRVGEKNLGHFKARNLHMPSARGEYVAMLDSDDYAFPDRLAKQVAYLDAHPRTSMVGSWAAKMDEDGRRRGFLLRPVAPDDIRAQQLFLGCFKHSAVMARRRVLIENPYPEAYPVSQDVALWIQLAERGELANLPEILIRYRWHGGGISKRRQALVREVKMKIANGQLDALEIEHGPDDLARHYDLRSLRRARIDRGWLEWASRWLVRLMEANVRLLRYPEPAFSRALGGRWLAVCAAALAAGVSPRAAARGTPLPRLARVSLQHDAALLARHAPALVRAWLPSGP